MKLAEALALRAETKRRIEQLRSRIVDNARYQEGETPSEDAAALLVRAASSGRSLRTYRHSRSPTCVPRPTTWHARSGSWTTKSSARTGKSTCSAISRG